MFLVVQGPSGPVTIPVAYPLGDGEVIQDMVGDLGDRTPAGTWLSSIRARKVGGIPILTRSMTAEHAAEARAALEAAQPRQVGGELIELLGEDPDYFEAICGPIAHEIEPAASGLKVRLSFVLRAA